MLAMTKNTADDVIQPLSRAVTKKIEMGRHSARPDEQTIRIEPRAERQPMPRAELIRLMTQSYNARRDRS